MIESKLIVGRYLNFVIPGAPAGVLGNFMTQAPMLMKIDESSGFRTKTSNISLGFGPKAHRNFQWLNWVSGSINQVDFGGIDVLTGPMSGCWIMNYKIGGIEYVGHVGTFNDPHTPQTIAAKAAWNAFAVANPLSVLGGFRPGWNGVFPPIAAGDQANGNKQFGLVTRGEYYTVAVWRKQDLTGYRIAGLQRVATSPLATLQNI